VSDTSTNPYYDEQVGAMEIPHSPVSRHDLEVIRREIVHARMNGIYPDEVLVSSRRVMQWSKVVGVPVLPSDSLTLNQGLVVTQGHEPRLFTFEEAG
jgi:hypothetical protein